MVFWCFQIWIVFHRVRCLNCWILKFLSILNENKNDTEESLCLGDGFYDGFICSDQSHLLPEISWKTEKYWEFKIVNMLNVNNRNWNTETQTSTETEIQTKKRKHRQTQCVKNTNPCFCVYVTFHPWSVNTEKEWALICWIWRKRIGNLKTIFVGCQL